VLDGFGTGLEFPDSFGSVEHLTVTESTSECA